MAGVVSAVPLASARWHPWHCKIQFCLAFPTWDTPAKSPLALDDVESASAETIMAAAKAM
jgi:hypothetical protein